MSSPWSIDIVVEGDVDEAVVCRVCDHVGVPVAAVYGKRGKDHIIDRLHNYNQAANFSPWLVVVDLDHDSDCAPDFVKAKLGTPSHGMCFRIAVRAIESWLLADAEQLAAFLHTRPTRFPTNPDHENDPKLTLIQLARRSTRKAIRNDMVPRTGSGRQVGIGYVGLITEFVTEKDVGWRPEVAMEHSDSLRRCIEALHTLKNWKPTE